MKFETARKQLHEVGTDLKMLENKYRKFANVYGPWPEPLSNYMDVRRFVTIQYSILINFYLYAIGASRRSYKLINSDNVRN